MPAPANDAQIDRRLPAHLPRDVQEHLPQLSNSHHDGTGQPCGCTACGARLRKIGQDVSEQLEYVPAHFKVIRHVRPKLVCVGCQTIFQASAPGRPIARGVAGAGLLAHVLVSKYCDHLPLYRQSGIYARSGVELDRSTLAGWVDQADQLLDPLVAALGRYTLAAAKIHADDTPVPVLQPGRGKTKTGRLWVYVRDDRPIGSSEPPSPWYQYTPDRKGEHPQRHLPQYRGILEADAYGGWGKLYGQARSPRPLAGRTRADLGGICTSAAVVTARPLQRKRSDASPSCMRSNATFGDNLPMFGRPNARRGLARCCRRCTPG